MRRAELLCHSGMRWMWKCSECIVKHCLCRFPGRIDKQHKPSKMAARKYSPASTERTTWRRRAARGEDVQGDAVGAGSQAELLPLEVKVPSLPLLVAHADAVGDGQRQRVGLLPEVQQLQLVEERSPGRDVRLSASERTQHRVAHTINNTTECQLTSMRVLKGAVCKIWLDSWFLYW